MGPSVKFVKRWLNGLMLAAGAVWFCLARPAWALSLQPPDDAALLAHAEAVVSGTVLSVNAPPGRETEETAVQLLVAEVIKGNVAAGETLDLAVPGGLDPALPGTLVVPGAPRFAAGEPVLVFLNRAADGRWQSAQLGLGAFEVLQAEDGEAVLSRALTDDAPMDPESGTPLRRYRSAKLFGEWLRAAQAGAADSTGAYWSAAATARSLHQTKYSLTEPLGRWRQFGQGGTVSILAGAGLLDFLGGGFSELQQAIAAWNNDASSNIALTYGGHTSATGGLSGGDGVTTVLFNDPKNQIAGIFSCITGGIAGTTLWRSSGSKSYYNGQLYYGITEADVVVQDGTGCLFNRRSGNLQELLAHELGHLLGLDHSCGDSGLPACSSGSAVDDALMRPTMHGDGRGARLGSDDKAAVAMLYGNGVPDTDTNTGGDGGAQGGGSGGGGAMPAGLLAVLMLLSVARLRRATHA